MPKRVPSRNLGCNLAVEKVPEVCKTVGLTDERGMVGTMRGSAPAGRRLDEQLALMYDRVRSNGSMGITALNFVAQHFSIPYDTVHRVCRKYHQEAITDPSFSLTFPQFTQIMRDALGKLGGGDLDHGTVDQARDLARSFTIYDATGTSPGRMQTKRGLGLYKMNKEVEDISWGPMNEDDSRGRTPLDTGLVTPRRLKTASFLPTTLNLTWSANRRGLCESARDSHFRFASTHRSTVSSHGGRGKSDTWHSEYMDLGKFYGDGADFSTAGEYTPQFKFPAHSKFETEANEIGRASRRLATGQLHEPPVRHPAEPRGELFIHMHSAAAPLHLFLADNSSYMTRFGSLGQTW